MTKEEAFKQLLKNSDIKMKDAADEMHNMVVEAVEAAYYQGWDAATEEYKVETLSSDELADKFLASLPKIGSKEENPLVWDMVESIDHLIRNSLHKK